MKRAIEFLGEKVSSAIAYVGAVSHLFFWTVVYLPAEVLFWLPRVGKERRSRIIAQMDKAGIASLPIVVLIAIFTGVVLALQSAYQMQKLSLEIYIASLVALSMIRELGPVLTALIVAGSVGTAITAELGTMKVTEQIDALETMAVNPVRYLVIPRFLALVIMLPFLTIYSNFMGIMGGYLVGVGKLGITSTMYLRMTWDPLAIRDLLSGLLKSLVFGMIIAIVGCFEGMRTGGGAEGVGKATRLSVVTSFVLIITADCLLTALFYFAEF